MHDPRQDLLAALLRRELGDAVQAPQPASADASFRRYWRVSAGANSYIVMDAPPERESIDAWLDIAGRLRRAGLNAPEVFAADRAHGLVLMSDLGSTTLLDALNPHTVDALYGQALAALAQMQRAADTRGLPDYDRARLQEELALFSEWFLTRHLGLTIDAGSEALIARTNAALIDAALEQPTTFVHRDYHSRNLMHLAGSAPGIIDFQDAVRGPLTYDLVSLLRDCYIRWPQDQVRAWAEAHRKTLTEAGLLQADPATFQRWFDLMGLQRHLKVLGIFSRLWYRDGKQGYLAELPRVLDYVLDVAGAHAQTRGFADWLRAQTADRELTEPRIEAPDSAAQH